MIKRPTEVYCCEECMKEKKEEEMSDERQETISDIVADIRAQNQGLPEGSYALSPLVCDLLSLADRIEAAHKREVTRDKSSQVGNSAKMRKALDMLLGLFDSELVEYSDSCDTSDTAQIQYVIDKAEAALSAPPRNCDKQLPAERVSADDVEQAWQVFKHRDPDVYFDVPGLLRFIVWLFDEAKGEANEQK